MIKIVARNRGKGFTFMNNNQKEFEKEYKNSVKGEADYIIEDLKRTAENKNYEIDIFIQHVINELNRLNNQ